MKNKDNTSSKGSQVFKKAIYYPMQVVRPVGQFLQTSLKILYRRKKEIGSEDPFKDITRLANNASPDTDAEEQYGHARTSAIKDQLNKKIIQTKKALAMIRLGKYGVCEDCGKMIDTDRLVIIPKRLYAPLMLKKEKNEFKQKCKA